MKFLVLRSVVIFIVFRLCRSEDAEEKYPTVNTTLGIIKGLYNISSEGEPYEAYLGIPYALPTTGDQRFEIAKPMVPWTGVFSATAYGSACMQIDMSFVFTNVAFVSGSEDCLYLNVYTPTASRRNVNGTSDATLPVIIFIHGGNFQFGNGSLYGPDYLLNEDVILVTINYRLGPLGFLSTEDDTVPGNMGLKDQVIAMRWVKDNILYFGGDPERITIVGQNAGAASVHYHYMTNFTAGLFQRGLSISGTALNCWAQTKLASEKAKLLASFVGCPTSDMSSMVDCLKTQPGDVITLASAKFMAWLGNPSAPFGPVVEMGDNELPLIVEPPLLSIIFGDMLNPPWIATSVSQEGLVSSLQFITNETLLKELDENWVDIAPHLLDFNDTIPEENKTEIALIIREHYFGTSPIDNSTINQIVQMISDRLFGYDFEQAVMIETQSIMNPIKFAHFSYRGAHSFSDTYDGDFTNYGVSWVDDVSYVLKSYIDPTTTEEDRKMQKVMIKFWVSYAADGEPDVGVEWPDIDPYQDELQYLHFEGPDNIYMNGTLNYGDKEFWLNLPFEENLL